MRAAPLTSTLRHSTLTSSTDPEQGRRGVEPGPHPDAVAGITTHRTHARRRLIGVG